MLSVQACSFAGGLPEGGLPSLFVLTSPYIAPVCLSELDLPCREGEPRLPCPSSLLALSCSSVEMGRPPIVAASWSYRSLSLCNHKACRALERQRSRAVCKSVGQLASLSSRKHFTKVQHYEVRKPGTYFPRWTTLKRAGWLSPSVSLLWKTWPSSLSLITYTQRLGSAQHTVFPVCMLFKKQQARNAPAQQRLWCPQVTRAYSCHGSRPPPARGRQPAQFGLLDGS